MQLNRSQGLRLPPEKAGQLTIPTPSPGPGHQRLMTKSGSRSAPFSTLDFTVPEATSALVPRSMGPQQLVELGASGRLDAWRGMGQSSFGSGRRMVLELTDALKEQRRNATLEAGYTLDGVGASRGDPALKLPRYLPYYDSKQVPFLKSAER